MLVLRQRALLGVGDAGLERRGVQELIHSPECPQSSFTGPLTYIVEQLKRRPMWRPGTGQVTMTGCVGATAMT